MGAAPCGENYEGRTTVLTMPAAPAVGAAIADYLRELDADDIPLDAPLSVAAVLCDLCRLVGLPVPAPVAAALSAKVTP